ncbi:MAG: hypothetical protein S4CHLAM7_02910 [Chlamydiae bacterium]|nr:hypothetical protein [Chlamydiota bacterium]
MSIQESRITDVTAKWELAERIAGHAIGPKQDLESIFKDVMLGMEKQAGITFDILLKERVWNTVSPERLKSITAHFLSEFCDKILGSFKVNEAERMLEEHKKIGFIKHEIFSAKIKTAYQLFFCEIINSVADKANSMKDSLVPEVFESLKREGIEFPKKEGGRPDSLIFLTV